MSIIRFGRGLRQIVCLYLTFAFFGSYAFATCSSVLTSATVATVTCTSAADQVVVSQVFGAWYHVGTSTFGTNQFDWDSTAGGEQDVFTGGTIIFANLGGGQLIIGDQTNTPADGLSGVVTLSNSGGASAQVTLDSTISSTGNTYTVNDAFAAGPITVGSLTYNDSTTAGELLTIITGTAADTLNVLSVYNTVSLTVQGQNGADHVNIGNAGSVQSISGPISILNTHNFSVVAIDDHADITARTATVASNSVSGIAPASISWNSDDVGAITLTMGTAADTVNVQSIDNPSNGVSLTIQGTNGADQVNIGNAGSVQGIAAPITVRNSSSFTALTIDDSADVTGRTGTIAYDSINSNGSVTGIAPAVITWSIFDLSGVTLNTGQSSDTVTVSATTSGIPVTIQGSNGLDQVNIGTASSVQTILGALTIQNTGGFTNLLIDDSADATARTASYTSTGIAAGFAPAAINWVANDIANVTLNMGTAAGTATNVLSTGSQSALTIHGTVGANAVNISNAGSVQGIQGRVAIFNPASFTQVVIDDSADATAREAHYTATGIAGLAPANITWNDPDVSSISVNLGSGNDVVHVLGSAPNNVITSINLGNGNNQCFISGGGLGVSSHNTITGGFGNDVFTISAVPTTVASLSIFGGSQTTGDEIVYTSGTVSGALPGNGTLVPTDPNAHSIDYNSIELFSIDDRIFANDFE